MGLTIYNYIIMGFFRDSYTCFYISSPVWVLLQMIMHDNLGLSGFMPN